MKKFLKVFFVSLAVLGSHQLASAKSYESDEQDTVEIALREAVQRCQSAGDNCPEFPEVYESARYDILSHCTARDVSWIVLGDIFKNYDYICWVESKN